MIIRGYSVFGLSRGWVRYGKSKQHQHLAYIFHFSVGSKQTSEKFVENDIKNKIKHINELCYDNI